MEKQIEDYCITTVEAAEILGLCPSELKDWERRFSCRLRKVRSVGGDEIAVIAEQSNTQIEMEDDK